MTAPIRPDGSAGMALDAAHAKLRAASRQLEGMFLNQLFQAMRKTVASSGSEAEQMFAGMMDEEVALRAAERSSNGLGEVLYRQLSSHLPPTQGGVGGAQE